MSEELAVTDRQTQRDKGHTQATTTVVGMSGELAVTDRQTYRETRDTNYHYQQ